MSLIPSQYECPKCFGLTGWPGDRARSNPLRKHLACSCEPQAAQEALLDLTVEQLTGEVRAIALTRTVAGPASPGAGVSPVSAIRGPSTIAKGERA